MLAFGRVIVLVLALGAPTASAVELAEFAGALERAELQYKIALRTLESSGRDETAAEVRLFREAWQEVIARLDQHRTAGLEGEESYAAIMTAVDARLVGALIVIDIGSREAARAALASIGETLARLRRRVEP